MPKCEPVTVGLLRSWPLPEINGTKNDRGIVLVIGGSAQTVGAVVLAGEAALRVGAGKVQIATVASRAAAVAVAVPEALVFPLTESPAGEVACTIGDDVRELVEGADVVLIGPGLAGDGTRELVEKLLPLVKGRLVLDALGLAAITPETGQLDVARGPAVLTPNLHELAITLGVEDIGADVEGAAAELVRRTGAVVHAGGERSITAAPDGLWRDDTGAPGLGVAGSGDVLAGVVSGLLGRGAEPSQAAVWAAHVHAEAGNRLAARIGPVGYLAREVVHELPAALRHIG
jgi:ADP-dependent NAD(P)H-hydrate dehydratase